MTTLNLQPEQTFYPDTGCEASTACLECPLPRCKHDDPSGVQRDRRMARDIQRVTLIYKEDLSYPQAALQFGVTVRTVFRMMARVRVAGGE